MENSRTRQKGKASRRAFLLQGVGLVAATAALASCSPEQTGSAATTVPTTPQQQAPAAASPTATATTAAAATSNPAWDQTLSAARDEGTVVVLGPADANLRQQLPAAFQARYGISMDYTGQSSGAFAARLVTERAGGVYSADIATGGSESLYGTMGADGQVANGTMGMFAPLTPLLLLPEVLDTSRYRQGKLPFLDPAGQYLWAMVASIDPIVAVNSQQVPPDSLTTWNDLLRPEYQGKIVTYDPTIAGAAVNHATNIYLSLGEDYLKNLYVGQNPLVVRDHTQGANALGSGGYVIALSLQPQAIDKAVADGLPEQFIPNPPEVPPSLSGGAGILGLLDHTPHPHAAQVCVNWLLGPEGAQIWQNSQLQASVRNDINDSQIPPEYIPQPGGRFTDERGYDFVLQETPKVQAILQAAMGH